MERSKVLINKLLEQSNNNADPSAIMVTVQMLHAELSRLIADAPRSNGSVKVSVVMPAFNQRNFINESAVQQEPELSSAPEKQPVKEVWALDPILETPTLAHQDEIKELNEKMGQLNMSSLNDKLKTERAEISSFLTETPVRDLKKAIGVNDRFLFLSELFRGDIDMYERSIKTINNFRILAEAEYWIERELKVKIGWAENTEAVKQFDQLVKRRFS